MKKILLLLPVLLLVIAGCSNITKPLNIQDVQKKLEALEEGAKIQVKELKALNDYIPGYSYIKVDVSKDNQTRSINLITNGQYIIQGDVLDLDDMSSLNDRLAFEFSEPKNIDVSKLTLAAGNKDAKNIIVEITDFQCPYCKSANEFLKEQLKDKKDYALYIMHLPITAMHPNARVMAQVYEAGKIMGNDFKDELFQADYIAILESKITKLQGEGVQFDQAKLAEIVEVINNEIIDKYAAKTSDAEKFKQLVKSEEVAKIVDNCVAQTEELGEHSTPSFYINGKNISGFKSELLSNEIDKIK